jgi:hypothetical protein
MWQSDSQVAGKSIISPIEGKMKIVKHIVTSRANQSLVGEI